ncbi:LOW QUALITY PROTEIN: 3-oxoadipate enol-lactone hydrolase, partial [Streptomyces sp. e14]
MPGSSLGRIVRGTGPGLLLAHGAGGGIDANYGPVLDVLAAHRTVVGPDYPGTGRTPRADAPLTLDGLADELVATAVEEGVETFAVAGYSLGAAVAVRAATRHPGRVTALVLTAGFAHPSPRFLLAARMWRDLLDADDPEALAGFLALVALQRPRPGRARPGRPRRRPRNQCGHRSAGHARPRRPAPRRHRRTGRPRRDHGADPRRLHHARPARHPVPPPAAQRRHTRGGARRDRLRASAVRGTARGVGRPHQRLPAGQRRL